MRQLNNTVGYAEFAAWEVNLVKGKARTLPGKAGFTYADIPDIEQELLLEVHLKRDTSDNWERVTASKKTVMSRILDNRIRNLIKSSATDKRRVHSITDSLSAETSRTVEGAPATLEDFLGEDHIVAYQRQSAPTPQDLQIDLSLRARELSAIQQRISNLLIQGFSITETAKALGIKRTTLNEEIDRMRALFYEEGLQNYLK
jgi:DNA-directed RNA polymerase specialized sigma24 family protein